MIERPRSVSKCKHSAERGTNVLNETDKGVHIDKKPPLYERKVVKSKYEGVSNTTQTITVQNEIDE